MTDHSLEELDERYRRHFEAERDAEMTLPPGLHANLASRIAATVGGAMAAGPETNADAGPVESPASTVASNGATGAAEAGVQSAASAINSWLAATTFTLGLAMGAGAYHVLVPPPQPEVRVEVQREVVYVPQPIPQEPHEVAPERQVEEVDTEAHRPRPHRPVAERPAPPPAPSGLAAERALLSRAQSAIARGMGREALSALEEHRTDYPQSTLTEERAALQVRALVVAGRVDRARAAAERFHRTYPRSIFRETVEEAVAER